MSDIEKRRSQYKLEYRQESYGRKITGLAIPFRALSQHIGSFREVVEPGAFDGADMSDISCFFNHDTGQLLARSYNGTGTLEWRITSRGLEVTVWLPNTTLGSDVWELVKRGDLKNFSFGFTVGEETYERRDGELIRHIWKFKRIYEVSLVVWPAYKDTHAEVSERALAELRSLQEVNELSNSLKTKKMNLFDYFFDKPTAQQEAIMRQMAKFYNNNLYSVIGKGDYLPVPWMNPQTRDLTPPSDSVGVSPWAILREGSVLDKLGITLHTDIPNNSIQLPVPDITSAAGFNWPGANGAAQEAITTIGGSQVTGKRVAGYITFSDLLYYADERMRFSDMIINVLKAFYQTKVQKTLFSTAGDANTPQGLLYGCTSTGFFTGTGVVSSALVEGLLNTVSYTVSGSEPAFVCHPYVAQKLRKTLIDTGSVPLLGSDGRLFGYRLFETKDALPVNISSTNYYPLFFGTWSELHFFEFYAPEILFDRTTMAERAKDKVHFTALVNWILTSSSTIKVAGVTLS